MLAELRVGGKLWGYFQCVAIVGYLNKQRVLGSWMNVKLMVICWDGHGVFE
jgi:hypothetical protein